MERIRPFVEAKDPGGKGDEETQAFETKMRREAEELKYESFGVELLHAIGTVFLPSTSMSANEWMFISQAIFIS